MGEFHLCFISIWERSLRWTSWCSISEQLHARGSVTYICSVAFLFCPLLSLPRVPAAAGASIKPTPLPADDHLLCPTVLV